MKPYSESFFMVSTDRRVSDNAYRQTKCGKSGPFLQSECRRFQRCSVAPWCVSGFDRRQVGR